MTPVDIMNNLDICIRALGQGNTELKTLGIKKAEAERKYRIALNKEILRLKVDKYPATLIQELARGNKEVADLRLNRDIAESSYYTAISAMDNLKIEIEVLRSKLTWLRAEFKNS